MEKIKMLILDDEGVDCGGKGYNKIAEWFPGVFDVTVVRKYQKDGMEGQALLEREDFDILLLDMYLDDYLDGLRIMWRVRRWDKSLEWQEEEDTARGRIRWSKNKGVWIIGCSLSWGEQHVGPSRVKKDHQLDGRARDEKDLRKEIARFLEQRKK